MHKNRWIHWIALFAVLALLFLPMAGNADLTSGAAHPQGCVADPFTQAALRTGVVVTADEVLLPRAGESFGFSGLRLILLFVAIVALSLCMFRMLVCYRLGHSHTAFKSSIIARSLGGHAPPKAFSI